jgi:predicted ester cyclase
MHGTHTGAFLGIPASGAKAEMKVMTLVRLQDGKVAEHWGRPDMMSLMCQIGALK